jgi:hypothetical protein
VVSEKTFHHEEREVLKKLVWPVFLRALRVLRGENWDAARRTALLHAFYRLANPRSVPPARTQISPASGGPKTAGELAFIMSTAVRNILDRQLLSNYAAKLQFVVYLSFINKNILTNKMNGFILCAMKANEISPNANIRLNRIKKIVHSHPITKKL